MYVDGKMTTVGTFEGMGEGKMGKNESEFNYDIL
jgi:hypothetical protein